jgi:Ca-activated chloride channel homolog
MLHPTVKRVSRQGRIWGHSALHMPAVMAVLASLIGVPLASGQPRVSITPRPPAPNGGSSARSNLRVDVKMILVPATVTDRQDRPVMDLPMEAFDLYEGDEEQKVVSLFREEGPISVGFLFDASGSMKKRMDRSIAAIEQFLRNSAAGDEFFLIRFSDRVNLVQKFTNDPDAILSGLSTVQPVGWTALLDAIYLGIQEMKSARHSRKALFILSDGSDNNSRYTESEVANPVRESDVRIYAVGLFERFRFLERLAAETGGRCYLARKMTDLPETIERLSNELRNQYMLGYYSSNADNDGKYHGVRVALLHPRL